MIDINVRIYEYLLQPNSKVNQKFTLDEDINLKANCVFEMCL